MARFTKALRQQLIRDFCEKNGGWYDPAAFLAEVERKGPKHPAYDWFEWDDGEAAEQYRIDQARDFARGMTVKFEVETIRYGKMHMVERSMPLYLSPLDSRRDHGGYHMVDPQDPLHQIELCRQAAQSLRWFLGRYEASLVFAGIKTKPLESVLEALENVYVVSEAAE